MFFGAIINKLLKNILSKGGLVAGNLSLTFFKQSSVWLWITHIQNKQHVYLVYHCWSLAFCCLQAFKAADALSKPDLQNRRCYQLICSQKAAIITMAWNWNLTGSFISKWDHPPFTVFSHLSPGCGIIDMRHSVSLGSAFLCCET